MKTVTPRDTDGTAQAAAAPDLPSPNTPFIKRLVSSGVIRFAGWWSIFAGALALNSVCPICGSSACPVGIGTTGLIAGVIAAVKLWGGKSFKYIGGYVRRRRQEDTGDLSRVCSCGSSHEHDRHLSENMTI